MSKKKHYGNRYNNQQQIKQFPQDHQEKPKGPKIYRTSTGFEYRLTQNLYDMRLIDALVTMQDPSIDYGTRSVAYMKALRFLLGEDQKEALFAHVVRRVGWADPKVVIKELMDIIANFEESKKK